jgi:hypothetical protein
VVRPEQTKLSTMRQARVVYRETLHASSPRKPIAARGRQNGTAVTDPCGGAPR